jgi:hypothetical protein
LARTGARGLIGLAGSVAFAGRWLTMLGGCIVADSYLTHILRLNCLEKCLFLDSILSSTFTGHFPGAAEQYALQISSLDSTIYRFKLPVFCIYSAQTYVEVPETYS